MIVGYIIDMCSYRGGTQTLVYRHDVNYLSDEEIFEYWSFRCFSSARI